MKFYIASDFGYARRWAGDAGTPIDPAYLSGCTAKEITLRTPVGEEIGKANCTVDVGRGTLTIDAAFTVPAPSKDNPKPVPHHFADIYLIPTIDQSIAAGSDTLHRVFPPVINWKEVIDHRRSVRVSTTDCSKGPLDDPAGCGLASEILGSSERKLYPDPQKLVVDAVRYATLRIVPALVFLMVLVNVLLTAVVFVGLIFLFDRKNSLVSASIPQNTPNDRGRVAKLRHVDGMFLGRRRLFEWLEVTGPALGFLLTVGALLIAFDAKSLVHGDIVGFSNAISMAMAATFAGLFMRIFAFTADRLLDYLLRSDPTVSAMGLVSGEEPKGEGKSAVSASGGET